MQERFGVTRKESAIEHKLIDTILTDSVSQPDIEAISSGTG